MFTLYQLFWTTFLKKQLQTTCAASNSPDGTQWKSSPPEINSKSKTTVVPVSTTLCSETIFGCLSRANKPASRAKTKIQ